MAVAEPVPHDLVNTRAALRACVEAVQEAPKNARLVNHLARVLRLSQRFEEALHYYRLAAELGNPSAYIGISEFYRQGIAVEPDYRRAFEAARTGALLGSPGCTDDRHLLSRRLGRAAILPRGHALDVAVGPRTAFLRPSLPMATSIARGWASRLMRRARSVSTGRRRFWAGFRTPRT